MERDDRRSGKKVMVGRNFLVKENLLKQLKNRHFDLDVKIAVICDIKMAFV